MFLTQQQVHTHPAKCSFTIDRSTRPLSQEQVQSIDGKSIHTEQQVHSQRQGCSPLYHQLLHCIYSPHGSHRPGKVMEFNPWLEKSLNFMFTWKNGILPGKVIENQWKSLKNFMCHVKLNLNMKTLMIIWLKVSLCHYIWDQIGETMLADLHSKASCYIVADSWTTCYIVAVKPSQAAYAGKASIIKAPCLWLFLMRSLWCRKLHLTGKK